MMLGCGAFESPDALQLDYVVHGRDQPEDAVGGSKWSVALDFFGLSPKFD